MIAREWKARCPKKLSSAFIEYLRQTGVKDTSSTPGCRGSKILLRELESCSEVVLVTYWDSYDSIKAFSGGDISVARLYPEDEKYQLDPDLFVTHYEVIEQWES